MAWDSLVARTKVHTSLAGACEAVPLGTVHHSPTHGDLLQARVPPPHHASHAEVAAKNHPYAGSSAFCISCGGPEEDGGHLRILCERDEAVAWLLCAKVEEFNADLPLADKAMGFRSWKEHGCRWTEFLMAGVVPGELKQLFAAMRAASSRGPAKAKLFVEDMIQIGEDGYARRNYQLNKIMQLPPGDRRKATYAFLRGDTSFCPPAGRVRQLPPWNRFDGLLDSL